LKEIDNIKKEKSPLNFFLLVFGLSAPLWLLQLFIHNTSLPLKIPITDIIAAFTPLFAACILTYKESGKVGVQDLLKRVFDYKLIKGIQWKLTLAGLPIIIFVSIFLIMKFLNISTPRHYNIPFASIPFFLIFFFLGAIGEEVGYMGYALDPIQKKYNALWAGIIIGIPWIVWHYPSIIQQGRSFNFMLWGTIGTIAFRIIYVWLYNNTNQSLFACILPHCLYNTGRVIFPHDETTNPLVDYPYVHYAVIIIIAVAVTVFWGQKTLTNFIVKFKATNR
jgi:hypothetical protein